MHYEDLKRLPEEQFKRFCGVSRPLFHKMLDTLRQQLALRSKPGGPTKLSIEDQLLVTLQYWREYRTYFHIAQDWGISESTVCRIVHKLEDLLIHSGNFSLPGKKQLLHANQALTVLVIDVAEHPIERPKKNNAGSTVVNRGVIPLKARS